MASASNNWKAGADVERGSAQGGFGPLATTNRFAILEVSLPHITSMTRLRFVMLSGNSTKFCRACGQEGLQKRIFFEFLPSVVLCLRPAGIR